MDEEIYLLLDGAFLVWDNVSKGKDNSALWNTVILSLYS